MLDIQKVFRKIAAFNYYKDFSCLISQDLPGEFQLRYIAGPFLSILAIILIEYIFRSGMRLYGMTNILIITILFSLFLGGMRSGIASMAAASLYLVYYSIVNILVIDIPYYFFISLTNIGIYILIIITFGVMKDSLLKNLARLEKSEMKFKKIEKELRQSEERYKLLVEMSPEGIFAHSKGKVVFANKVMMRIMGAESLKQVVGMSVMDLLHPDCRDIAMERILYMHEFGGSVPSVEEKLIRMDGGIVEVEIASCLVHGEEGEMFIGLVRDTSMRKRLEEMNKKVEEKSTQLNETLELERIKTEFFANISHELRTPLNVILGTLQLLDIYLKNGLTSGITEKIGRNNRVMKQNCYRLLRLVNNLIDITKIDTGCYELHPQDCNIVSIIEEVTLSVAQYIESKEISLLFDTDEEEKLMACDPDKVERIMLNLLSNAVKFTAPGGSISVNVRTAKEKIEVTVRDSGIGVPDDKRDIIFERFRQVDQLLTRNQEGSGIGLSLVKSLVEMHGGEIRLESEYGKGSSFIFEIPAGICYSSAQPANDYKNMKQSHIERINVEFSDIYR